jgi:hypothetical protein
LTDKLSGLVCGDLTGNLPVKSILAEAWLEAVILADSEDGIRSEFIKTPWIGDRSHGGTEQKCVEVAWPIKESTLAFNLAIAGQAWKYIICRMNGSN